LAADPQVLEKSGGLYSSWGLAREYGFTDLDGSRPDLGRHVDFEEQFQMSSKTGFRWTVAPVPATKRKTESRSRTRRSQWVETRAKAFGHGIGRAAGLVPAG